MSSFLYTTALSTIYSALKFILRADTMAIIYSAVAAQTSTALSGEEKHNIVKAQVEAFLSLAKASNTTTDISGTLIDVAIKVILLVIRNKA